MTCCERMDEVRDYAFDELDGAGRKAVEAHIAECEECAGALDQLQLTTAAMRVLPDREIPQRIAFVSDKVLEPSAGWFAASGLSGFWNSAARLGFASACVLATGLVIAAYHPGAGAGAGPAASAGSQTVVSAQGGQASSAELTKQFSKELTKEDVARQVDAAVARAVSQVRIEDAKLMQTALDASDHKHEQEHRSLMVAMEENLTYLSKQYSTVTMLAANDAQRAGAGQ